MVQKRFRIVKPEIRVLGVDDGVFVPHRKGLALVVGVVFRGGYWLDGVMSTMVEVDGVDATDKIISMVLGSPHHKQLRVMVLNGVTLAGFNVVDLKRFSTETGLPVITVTREKPDLRSIHSALGNLADGEKRWRLICEAGEPFETYTRRKSEKIYVQVCGASREVAERILRLTSTRSNVPEALRVAHLIASGISGV